MSRPKVLHLIDDTTAGGVTRVVDHVVTSPELASDAKHRLKVIKTGRDWLHHRHADVIVSHLSVNWRNLPRFLMLRLCNPKARLIHVEHSYSESFVRLNVRRKARFNRLLRLAYGLFDRIAAVSHAQGEWLCRFGAVPAGKLALIRSFVDLSEFGSLPPVEGSVRVIGAIGRLEAQKGFDALISAFRSSGRSDLELHVFGTGSEEEKLKALAAGDPRIKFQGFAEDPVAAMRSVDAVVMPSRWEAYGLVAIEALAARRLVFVNDIDGLRDHLPLGARVVPTEMPGAWHSVFDAMPKEPLGRSEPHHIHRLEMEFLNAWKAEVLPAGTGRASTKIAST